MLDRASLQLLQRLAQASEPAKRIERSDASIRFYGLARQMVPELVALALATIEQGEAADGQDTPPQGEAHG